MIYHKYHIYDLCCLHECCGCVSLNLNLEKMICQLPISYFFFSVQRRRRANSPAGSNTYGTALIKDKSPSFHQQHQPFQLRQHPPQQQKTEDVRSARKQVNIFPFPPIYPRFFRQING